MARASPGGIVGAGRAVLLLGLIAVPRTALADEAARPGLALPPDPVPPVSADACAALYASYRTLVERLRYEARACNARASPYARLRYGRPVGAGECALRVVEACRGLVEDCVYASTGMADALARCRAMAAAGD